VKTHLITDARPARRACTVRSVLRGLWAVVALLAGAVDHYLTALAGLPPLAWCARRFAGVIAEAYRRGRYGPRSACTSVAFDAVGVCDAEFVDVPAGPAGDPHRKETTR
jgi:hypothetical protein